MWSWGLVIVSPLTCTSGLNVAEHQTLDTQFCGTHVLPTSVALMFTTWWRCLLGLIERDLAVTKEKMSVCLLLLSAALHAAVIRCNPALIVFFSLSVSCKTSIFCYVHFASKTWVCFEETSKTSLRAEVRLIKLKVKAFLMPKQWRWLIPLHFQLQTHSPLPVPYKTLKNFSYYRYTIRKLKEFFFFLS